MLQLMGGYSDPCNYSQDKKGSHPPGLFDFVVPPAISIANLVQFCQEKKPAAVPPVILPNDKPSSAG